MLKIQITLTIHERKAIKENKKKISEKYKYY